MQSKRCGDLWVDHRGSERERIDLPQEGVLQTTSTVCSGSTQSALLFGQPDPTDSLGFCFCQ